METDSLGTPQTPQGHALDPRPWGYALWSTGKRLEQLFAHWLAERHFRVEIVGSNRSKKVRQLIYAVSSILSMRFRFIRIGGHHTDLQHTESFRARESGKSQ